jgi:hypothetical protein
VKDLVENPNKGGSSGPAAKADDPILLKFMDALKAAKFTLESFFERADPNGDGEISLVEIKNAIKKELPKSNISIGISYILLNNLISALII